ncbi:universal stress protein [Natrialbaceae archaeon A-chndr2]
MNKGLVVIEDTDHHRSLLETAGELAAGAGAELVLLSMKSTEDVAADRDAIAQVNPDRLGTYGTDTAEQQLRHTTHTVARDALADTEVDYEVAPKIVDSKTEATAILDSAEEHGCDHIFMVGRKRSPTGKALFGDLAQSVMLAFDGQVTVELE